MSTIPVPTSIPEAQGMIDDAISYFDSADFRALPAETRIEYLERFMAIARAAKTRLLTEYIRRRWDGTVRGAYERPMTSSMKVNWSGVRSCWR